MKKSYRIKKKSEIDAIFKTKKVKGDSYFALYQSDDESGDDFRFALSIGKKFGNAVLRNLAKRRIRMIVSEFKGKINKKKNFVIVVRPKARELNYQEIDKKIKKLIEKSKLTEKTNEK